MNRLPPLPRGLNATLSNEASARLDQAHPDIPRTANCITCKGAKSYRWWNYYGGSSAAEPTLRNFDDDFVAPVLTAAPEVVEYECNCPAQYVAHRNFLYSGIGLTYQRLCWEDATDVPQSAKQFVRDFTAQAEWNLDNGIGMILRGTIGSGKSLLAMLMLKELIGRGYSGYFTTFTAMMDLFAASWRDPDEKRWFERQVKNAQVLVIDDIGRENRHVEKVNGEVVKTYSTAMAESTIDTVLRHRLANAKATFITTNLSQDELAIGYGANVFSLLGERSLTCDVVSSTDYRAKAMARIDIERDLQLTRPIVVG